MHTIIGASVAEDQRIYVVESVAEVTGILQIVVIVEELFLVMYNLSNPDTFFALQDGHDRVSATRTLGGNGAGQVDTGEAKLMVTG